MRCGGCSVVGLLGLLFVVWLLGIGGDEIIGSITNLMYGDIPCSEFRKSVHIHPTVTELLPFILDELVTLE